MGWSTERLDETLNERERMQALLERRARFAKAAQDATGHVRETYLSEIEEIDEVLAAPLIDEAEQLEAEADELERQAENFETRDSDTFEGTREKALEQAREKRDRAEELRRMVDRGAGAESMGATPSGGDAQQSLGRSSTSSVAISTTEALAKWGIDRSELDEAIEDCKETRDHSKQRGNTGMMKRYNLKLDLLKAAAAGKTTLDLDSSERRKYQVLFGL